MLIAGVIFVLAAIAFWLMVIVASAMRCKQCGQWCEDDVECELNRRWK